MTTESNLENKSMSEDSDEKKMPENGAVSNGECDLESPTTDGDQSSKESPESEGKDDSTTANSNAMALNVAYEALEQVRQANVENEFGRQLGPKECIACLREPQPTSRFRMPRLARASPCLTCGNPVCPRHSCPELKRENINICIDCSSFFAVTEFVTKIQNCQEADRRRQYMNHMLDVYDRALLILLYSSQFIEEIVTALEVNTKRNNQIGLGSSATGVVSGIAGVAAAVTIFTPVGPPLLIASILFGGGATAVSASSEAVNYHCTANKMADTIYAVHGMVQAIAKLAIEGQWWKLTESASSGTEDSVAAAPLSNTQLNDSTKKAQVRNWTRATANALKPLTAGALSAASVFMEAKAMKDTLDKINAGSPCEKAESLRKIGSEMELLPSTALLAEIAPKFFNLK